MQELEKKGELVSVLKAKLVKRMINPSDVDKIDVFALYDSSLSIKENLKALMGCDELSGIEWKQSKTDVKAKMAEIQARIATQERQELKNELLTVRKVGTPQLMESVKCFLGTRDKALVVLGDGGLGKTSSVLSALQATQTNFILHSSHTTPLALMLSLQASNDVLHVFDDVVSIWRDPGVLGIIKGAADKLGIVKWEKTIKGSELVEMNVKFKGKILILCNEIERNGNSDVLAVLDRVVFYEHCPTSREIIETAECDEKVKQDLLAGLNNNPFLKYSYRTVELLQNVLKNENEYNRRLLSIVGSYPETLFAELQSRTDVSTSQKAKEWSNLTGKNVRTWWRWLKQVKRVHGGVSSECHKTNDEKVMI